MFSNEHVGEQVDGVLLGGGTFPGQDAARVIRVASAGGEHSTSCPEGQQCHGNARSGTPGAEGSVV